VQEAQYIYQEMGDKYNFTVRIRRVTILVDLRPKTVCRTFKHEGLTHLNVAG
jgi:hypothetical protein